MDNTKFFTLTYAVALYAILVLLNAEALHYLGAVGTMLTLGGTILVVNVTIMRKFRKFSYADAVGRGIVTAVVMAAAYLLMGSISARMLVQEGYLFFSMTSLVAIAIGYVITVSTLED